MLLRRKTRSGTTGRLYSIAVEPEFRGKGIGKALLMECLEALRRENVSACVLEVDDENKPAIALYEKAGFKKVRLLPHYYGTSRHGWKMRMNLAAAAAAPAAGLAAPGAVVQAGASARTANADHAGAMALVQSAGHA